MRSGLETSKYCNVDDTGSRHNGKNGYCTHIGNELFAWFESTGSKSRINFLELLSAGNINYVLNAELKAYKLEPDNDKKAQLEARFDEIFVGDTCFASLTQALKRISQNKPELLLVLEYPDIPLHNNLSESDIREYVKKRKISGSTRSDEGRRCRDTFTSLKKTCRKQGISFWKFLNDRIIGKQEIPFLPELIFLKAQESIP